MAVISNSSDNTLITGTDMSDSIKIGSGYATYSDRHYGKVTVDAGAGNDTIVSFARQSSINASTENDFIDNRGASSTIDGGAGNDTITNIGNYVSINGGMGDDSIYTDKNKVVGIFYNEGDGNDTVEGFNSSSMIQIGDGSGTYATQQSGSDVIVYVGDGSIVLTGAASLSSKIYINGVDGRIPAWRINGTTATYGTSSNTLITVSGVKSLNSISLNGNVVTIDESALNQGTVTISNGYALSLGNNVTTPNYTAASWSLSGNTAIYSGGANTAGYELSNNQISYVAAKSSDSFTVSGVKSTNGLTVAGNVVTVGNSALNQETVTISNNNYTLALGNDVTQSTTAEAGWTLSGTSATYKTAATSAGYKLANNQISYVAASGGESVKVSGVKSLDGLSISGKTVTVSNASLNQSKVTVSDGYTLKLGNDVATPSSVAAGWTVSNNIATYKAAQTTAGYSVSDNQITYAAASGGSVLAQLSDVKGKPSIESYSYLTDKVIISADNFVGNEISVVSNAGDYIFSLASGSYGNVVFNGGTGNDVVWNYGSNLTINGGNGDDYIKNEYEIERDDATGEWITLNSNDNVFINGGAGNDSVYNLSSDNCTINTGDGNDFLYNEANNVSMSGGAGNDSIENWGGNVTFIYKEGDGKDTIYGINSTSTLSIAGGTYSTQISNADVIVAVGGEKINLHNVFATADTLNINDDKIVLERQFKLTDGDDYVYGIKRDSISVDADAGNDRIDNYGDNVKIDGGAGNDSIYNEYGDNVSINGGDGDDYISNSDYGSNVKIDGGAGNDSIQSNGASVTINAGNGNDTIHLGYYSENNLIVYNAGDGNDVIYGFKANSTLSIGGGTYLKSTSGDNVIVTVGTGKITLNGAASLASVNIAGEEKKTWQLNGTTATYGTSTDTLITVSGVKSLNGISLSGSTVTIANSSLNQSPVTISKGYTLALANDVTRSQTTSAHWELKGSTATYKNTSTSAGYSVVSNQIVYNEANGGEALITVNGVKSLDGISQSGSNITIANSSLNQSNVTISNGYNLKLQGVAAPKHTAAHFDGMTYKSASNTAGYTLADNQITYTPAVAEKDLFTISGVKNTSGITIDGTTVKIPLSALNKANVTISNKNYNLALADDVKPPETTEAGWTLNGTTAIYKNASTTAGYSLNANNQIVYTPASGGETLITVKGVKSLDGLSLSGKVVNVKASSLNKSKVTISGDYKLALDDDEVPKPKTTKAWSFNKNDSVATYKQKTTAGYTLAKNAKSISYSNKSTKNLITVKGVKSANGLKLNSRVVTVPKAALNQKTVTVSDGFTLKLGNGVATPETASANWVHNGTTATYKSSSTSAGYSTSSDGKSITYSLATASSTLATIKGIKDNVNPTPKSKVITLKKANLSGSKVTVSGSYGFNFAKGNYNDTSIVGSKNKDSITSNGSNLSIKGGNGNDVISLSSAAKNNVIVYNSGEGNDTIYGLDDNDTLKIATGTTSVTTKGNDVIFTVGNGKITVKGGVGKTINYVDKNGENTYPKSKSVTLTEDYAKKTYTMGKELRTLDASAVQRDLEITGNEFMNKLIGGAGNDTLIGGKSNDTLKGGDGSDVFVYANGDGNDVITDYTEDDMIRFTKGTAKVTSSDKDVIFTVGTGKLTVKNAKSKVITYIDDKGKTNYYPAPKDSVIINGVTVKILEEYESKTFDVGNVKNGNKVEMIDAALVSHDLKIVGNAQANVILGGFGDDTIIGGKNNDTLQGGDGKNVFVYANGDGNDVIVDYNTGDKISLVSGAVISSSVKGDDVVLKVGKNKITLNNGVDKVITAIDKDGNNRIIGGTKNDNIKGDKGADTLQGGKGNDSLWGNAGADTFIYNLGDGKDVIYGFDSKDTLTFDGIDFRASMASYDKSKGTLTFNISGGSVTLKDFTAKTFHINKDTYKISGKKLV